MRSPVCYHVRLKRGHFPEISAYLSTFRQCVNWLATMEDAVFARIDPWHEEDVMKISPPKANKLKSGNKAPDRTKAGINKKIAVPRKPGKEQSQWGKS